MSFGVDGLRLHKDLDFRAGRRIVVDSIKLDDRGIFDPVPIFAVFLVVAVVKVFKNVTFNRAFQNFREIVLRRGVAALHSLDVDFERGNLFTKLAALRAEVEILPSFRRNEIGFGENLIESG